MKEPRRHIHRTYSYNSDKNISILSSEPINFNMLTDDQIKISQLPPSSGIDNDDIMPFVQVSGTGLITKNINFQNLKNSTFNSTLSPSGNIEFYYDNNSSTLYIYTNATGVYDTLVVNDKTGSGLLVYNDSPNLTGIPTAPTASSGTNTTQIANTQFVRTEVANLVNSAPETLDTLNELALALDSDPNFSTTIVNALANKASLSGSVFTGYVIIPSGSGNFNNLQINNVDVSTSGHSHLSSDISNFDSSVSGLLPTINNSGNNKLLTSTGSPYGIDAEENLTFDNLRLTINCDCPTGSAGYEAIGNNNKSTLIRQQSYSDNYFVEINDEEIQTRATNRFIALSARGTKESPQPLQIGDTIFIMRNDAYNPHGTLYNGNLDNRTMRLYSFVSSSGTHYLGSDFVINTSTGGSGLFDTSFRFTHDGKLLINGVNIASPSGIDISNNGNDRVLTSTGSGINSESNLTFDGTTLNISGALDVDNIRINNNTIQLINNGGLNGINIYGYGDALSQTLNVGFEGIIAASPGSPLSEFYIQTTGNRTISVENVDNGFVRISGDLEIGSSGNILLNGDSILVNGIDVSVSGHVHTASDITDFSSSVSGLLNVIPQSHDNYIVCKNGDDLVAKYGEAKLLTPGGNSLSSTNRATLIVMPGTYVLNSELYVDTDYVDVLGLGSNKLNRGCKTSVTTTTNSINVTANDVRIKGITVDSFEFKTNGNSGQIFEDCIGLANSSFGGSTTVAGTFINCIGYTNSFGGSGAASGTFISCIGDNDSFGGNGTASGVFINCSGGSNSFGGTGTASGSFENCVGLSTSFAGYNGTASGTFKNCVGGNESFGGEGGTASGTFDNCKGGYVSFGGGTAGGTASGSFNNCIGEEYSFGGTTCSGTFINCVGKNYSFGGSSGNLTGILLRCILNNGYLGTATFLTPTSSGKLRLCIDGNYDIINDGE